MSGTYERRLLAGGGNLRPEGVECHRRVTGEEPSFFSFTGTTDARILDLYYDIPATCYGRQGANLHAPDEWVHLESVRKVTKVLALSAIDWCGTA